MNAPSNYANYFVNSRPEMLQFVPVDAKKLLDVGCAQGGFAAAIKERQPDCEVWGIEPTDAAKVAATRLDKVIQGLFSEDLDLPRGYFDVVTMTDVLEHIVDTDAALRLVRELLRPGGTLVLSLPNVQFYVHVYNLIKRNSWEYVDDGIMDRTHVRFFTTKSAQQTLERNGFKVQRIEGLITNWPTGLWRVLFRLFRKTLYWAKFFQFAVVARRD